MTNFRTRVTVDAGLLTIACALVGGGLGGRSLLLGVLAGGAIAVADFWWLSARVNGLTQAQASAWVAAAGLRLGGVAVAVAALFLTGWFHPVGLVIGLAALPCALVARGLYLAREGA
jgi:hypothetical protein